MTCRSFYDDEPYYVLPFFWVPEDTLELRVRRDHVPYDIWKAQGSVMTTEGNVIHYGFIEKFIFELGEKYNIREIAYDRWGEVQMSQALILLIKRFPCMISLNHLLAPKMYRPLALI